MDDRCYKPREYEYEIVLKRDGDVFARKNIIVINRWVSNDAAKDVLYMFEEIMLSEAGIPWIKQDKTLSERLRYLADYIDNDPPPKG